MFKKGEKHDMKPRTSVSHEVRTPCGDRNFTKYTRSLAIRLMCTECMGYTNPMKCTSLKCALFPFRKYIRHDKGE